MGNYCLPMVDALCIALWAVQDYLLQRNRKLPKVISKFMADSFAIMPSLR